MLHLLCRLLGHKDREVSRTVNGFDSVTTVVECVRCKTSRKLWSRN